MTNRKTAVTRRVAAVTALVLATAAAWAMPASADDAVAAVEGDQLTVVVDGNFPSSHYAGLDAGAFDLRVSNLGTKALNDVYIELDTTVGAAAGMQLSTTGSYYNSKCSQAGGAGTPILCGPLSVPAGSSTKLSSAAGKGVSVAPGHDYLLDNGSGQMQVTARGLSESAGVAGTAEVVGSMWVVSDGAMQTSITFSAPGGAAGSVPSVGRYEVSSPQELDMHWRIVNGGYSSFNDMTATMTVPTGLEIVSLPTGCTMSGQELTCVRDYAKWGSSKTFVVPVRVTSGLAVGTELVIDDLHGSVYSPNEPTEWPMWQGYDTWEAKSGVGAPYTLVITEAAEVVTTDVAVSHTHVDDITAGTTVALPFAFDDLDEATGAAEVTATIELAGMDFESVSTTIEGCTATDATVTCTFGDLAALDHIEGTVDVALPQVDEGSFTVTASVSTATEDRDLSNNTLTDEYVITADVVDPDPEPEPGPGEETTGPDEGGTTNDDTATDDTTTEEVLTGVLAITGGSTLPILAGAGVLLLGGTAAVLTRRRATARH